jgi:Flp pilus assembly pilin Flp
VEYGLLVAAIAGVVVGLVFGLGGVVAGVFDEATTCLETRTGGYPC